MPTLTTKPKQLQPSLMYVPCCTPDAIHVFNPEYFNTCEICLMRKADIIEYVKALQSVNRFEGAWGITH